MSDQKFNSLNEPSPESQSSPLTADPTDTIRSAFHQQEDTPQIEQKPPSGIGGFFQNVLNSIKDTLGIGENTNTANSTFEINNMDLLPIDEEYPMAQEQELEANFTFIEQERMGFSDLERSRTKNNNFPAEIPVNTKDQKDDPEATIENAVPSANPSQPITREDDAEEDELDLESFLPGTNGFSQQDSPTWESVDHHLSENPQSISLSTGAAAFEPDENTFTSNKIPEQKESFTSDDLKAFLSELDSADDTQTFTEIEAEQHSSESENNWNPPRSPSSIHTRILAEETEIEDPEQDNLNNLRSMFNEEEISSEGTGQGEKDFTLSEPHNQFETLKPDVNLNQTTSDEFFPDDDPTFNITEEEIEAVNPEDFLPDNLLIDLDTDVFIFDDEETQTEVPYSPTTKQDLHDGQPENAVKPFSLDSETGQYFDNLRSTFESDEQEDLTGDQLPLARGLDLSSAQTPAENESQKPVLDVTTPIENNELYAKFEKEYEDTPKLEDEKTQNPKNKLGGFFSRFSKWSLKEELLVAAAILFGLLVFATIAIFSINWIFLPLIKSFRTSVSASDTQMSQVEVVDPDIYPTSLKLPGGWVFSLQESTIKDGLWKPVAAEYLQGTTVRRVVAIPWSKQTEAVISTFEKGDEILLFMNNNDIKGYQVQEVKEIARDDTSILTDTRSSLVVILYNPEAASRWVVISKP